MRSDVVLCDLAPYRHSTRTKKVGTSIARRGRSVHAIALSRVGRLGMADDVDDFHDEGVSVEQIRVPPIDDRRTLPASVRNLLTVYAPALWRMRRRVLETPAEAIFVGHISLIWIGLAHNRRWGSKVVVNGRERPGGVRTKGSLATWFSRAEPAILRLLARTRKFAVVAVCESHGQEFRNLGVRQVIVVRNVPSASYAPVFRPPPSSNELVVACVGSLYPGRGIEALIDGVVDARSRGARVRLDITGPAGEEYLQELNERIAGAQAGEYIAVLGPCTPTEVAARYQNAHVGTALYEATDAANDSLSNKLFECIVAGRPVIAGNLPENSKVITEHEVGWLANIDSNSLSDLIYRLAESREDMENKAQHCYDVGRQHFVWEKEVSALERILSVEESRNGR